MSTGLTPSRAGAIAVAAAVAAHCGALGAGFVFDDRPYYADSAFLDSLGSLGQLFSAGYWQSGELSWRPVAVGFHVVQRALIGVNPMAHAVSVALHAWVVWLLVRWLIDLKLPPAAAAAGAVCFAVHPALTETVVQVSFAEDLLAAALLLLSCRLIAKGPGGWGRAAAAAGIAMLAMGAKESALIFPVCWALSAWRSERDWSEGRNPTVAVGAVALLLFALLRFVVFANPAPSVVAGLPSLVTGDLWILGRYGAVLGWPWTLCADYSVPDPVPAAAWAVGLVVPGVGGLVAWRRRETAPGLLWFGAALLPVMNLGPLSSPVAERFLYLPAIGLAWAVAATWGRLTESQRPVAVWLLGALCLAGVLRSQARARDYDNPDRFWSTTVRANPASLRGLQNLAGVRLEQGQVEAAVRLYRRRLELYPDQPDGRFSLALALRQWSFASKPGSLESTKRLVEAETLLRNELQRWPESWKARVLLADLQIARQQFQQALALLDLVSPAHHASVHYLQTRITALARLGRRGEARMLMARALQLHPQDPGLNALARAVGR